MPPCIQKKKKKRQLTISKSKAIAYSTERYCTTQNFSQKALSDELQRPLTKIWRKLREGLCFMCNLSTVQTEWKVPLLIKFGFRSMLFT